MKLPTIIVIKQIKARYSHVKAGRYMADGIAYYYCYFKSESDAKQRVRRYDNRVLRAKFDNNIVISGKKTTTVITFSTEKLQKKKTCTRH